MSVHRIMGTETEYAISVQGIPASNPVQLSFDLVSAASNPRTAHIRWDYGQENPVCDARGFHLPRAQAPAGLLTDEPSPFITNVIAANAGRVYVDHAHPEYSSPETDSPFDAVLYDRAGDEILRRAAETCFTRTGNRIQLHKNNVDGKGASWGSHENYMVSRSVDFDTIAALMTLHFVSRQIYTGSGRVGIGEHSEIAGFQLSQRADYIQSCIGLQTTFNRPIINTRDEPHSTDESRRLHVIVGDANIMDIPQALKLGVTSMLLWLLENAQMAQFDIQSLLSSLCLMNPVEALQIVSHDLTLSRTLRLFNGGETTAWQIQISLLSAVFETAARVYGTDSRGEPSWPDEDTTRIMSMWKQALSDIAAVRHADDDTRLGMHEEARRLEWLLKWQLLERLRRRWGATWNDMRLSAMDLQWAALDPQVSIFRKVAEQAEKLYAEHAIHQASEQAPSHTRAWLRAELIRRFPEQIAACSWTHITVRDKQSANGITTLDMSEPRAYTRASSEYLFAGNHTSITGTGYENSGVARAGESTTTRMASENVESVHNRTEEGAVDAAQVVHNIMADR